MSNNRYLISELAKICGLNVKTLRFYDKVGILKPAERGEDNNYRYYTESQILMAVLLREMRLRGLSCSEIQQMLHSNQDYLIEFRNCLESKVISLQDEINQLQQQQQRTLWSHRLISNACALQESKIRGETEIEIRTMPKYTVLYTRYKSHVYAKDVLWDRVIEITRLRDQENALVCGPLSGVYHDHYLNQFFFEDGDLEIYLPVEKADTSKPYVKTSGGFMVASKIFVGHYFDLLPTYIELVKFIERSKYMIVGPPIEEYIVEFSHVPSSDDYVTRVNFPIKEKA